MPQSVAVPRRPIAEVAADLDLNPDYLEPFGRDKAKVRLEALTASGRMPGKLVLVSAITPTPAGEGKTTVSIGLAQGLRHIGQRAVLALRQPSMGPVFGRKGGATGGGASTRIYHSLTPNKTVGSREVKRTPADPAATNMSGTIVSSFVPTRTLSAGSSNGYEPTRSGLYVSSSVASSCRFSNTTARR
jgi:hypothetical protein